MRLTEPEARDRLAAHGHGVLATVHAQRGVDAVPVVFAVDLGHLAIPIDRVKPKASGKLQRERNLEADPRATLLVDHWDADDWTRLWWVRAELRWQAAASPERLAELADRLADAFAQYRQHPFERVLIFEVVGVTGWSASTDHRLDDATTTG